MNDLELIDDYFSGRLTAEERVRFETSLETDSERADSVAFYLATRKAAQTEANSRRKAEFEQLRKQSPVVRTFPSSQVIALAAMVVLVLGLGVYWLFQRQQGSATEIADQYIQQNYSQLTHQLGGPGDSLQAGVSYYNQGNFTAAGAVFEDILQKQPTNDRVLLYAGLVAIRTKEYNQAIDYFHRLGERTDLYANPGLLLEAISRLKRNQPTDPDQAEALLKTVVEKNLEGKAQADALLKSL